MTLRRRAALSAYSVAMRCLAPVYLARLWWRGRAEAGYRDAMCERFGLFPRADDAGWLWIHAVSLGETRAAQALISALRGLRPDVRLLLTHGTATGRQAGAEVLREGDRQAWLPFDTPGSVDRFLRHFRPLVGVLMETEVWPNLLHAAQRHAVPVVLANARLSEKSMRQSVRLDALMRPAASRLAMVLAQTDDDAMRLRQAGAVPVEVCGNLKYDLAPAPELLARGLQWRQGLDRDVVLAAITREGEEAQLLNEWAKLPEPRPLLLIVPRHPQRFDEVADMVAAAGFSLARRSAWGDGEPAPQAGSAQVWLGDSMHEMPLYYALAKVALLGGSFEPLGGHNLIEAAACGCPLVMGPHTFNFAEASQLSIAAGAAWRVGGMAAGVRESIGLLNPARQAAAASHALAFAARHRGAARRMAERIAALLPRR